MLNASSGKNATQLISSPDPFATPAWQAILAKAKLITLPANHRVFRQGDICQHYLLLKSGAIKVFTRAQNGREILLYRVEQGQSCTLTTSCLLANNRYPAEGISEIPSQAWLISVHDFNQQLNNSAHFRQLVFNSYAQRLSDVITLVAEVSFTRIDVRIAKWLTTQVHSANKINVTHQQIATDLGSAREVISRQLKAFEQQGWLKLTRGVITVINHHALQDLTATSSS